MADTPSKQDLYDEAAMQDAIAAKKATGGLVEVNPQDAPAPVKSEISARETKNLPRDLPAQPTAEDKAFDELAARQQSSQSFAAKEAARRAAPASDKGQGR